MGKAHTTYHFLVLLVVSIFMGCKTESPTTVESTVSIVPQVLIRNTDFTRQALQSQIPDANLMGKFAGAYAGKYSDALKQQLVEQMIMKATALDISVGEFKSCLNATGQHQTGMVSLPYLAVRARFEGKEVWIFEFIWGVHANDLAHYRCYAVSISTWEILFFATCK